VAGEGDLFQRVLTIVVDLLDVALGDDAQEALKSGGTASAEASSLFAQGLRTMPYQAAQNKLERHDQQASLEQAVELFSRAIELDPAYAHAYAGLGEAYLRLFRITRNPEHFRLAESHCQRAISLDRLVGQAWLTLGNVRTESGRADEALKDFEQAKLMRPRSPEVYRDTAQAYTRLQRFPEAEAQYAKAIELRPDYWLTYYYYGSFLYRRARYEEAERTFKQALATGVPDNARLHSSIGGTLFARGRVEEAQREFERSFEIQQTASAASNMGTLLYRRGDFPAAATWFEKAAELSPQDYRMWRHAGAAYNRAPGQRDRAAGAYRKALAIAERELALDPTDGRVIIDAADCLSMLGDKPRALSLTADALARTPQDPEVQYTAADIYETLGERAAALRHLELALRAGYQRTLLEASPGFANLRADPRYKQLIASLPAGTAKPR
jgi:tetratricopeptide (TPR) repeat protein